jgi:hypothetical protein
VVNVVRAEHGVVNPVNDVTVLNPRGQPQGQILQQQLTSIENDALSVGIDVARGGVVGEITSPVMPPPLTGRNLVNVWDCGRLVQQSYYGCSDGSCWASKPWRWNPGGCLAGARLGGESLWTILPCGGACDRASNVGWKPEGVRASRVSTGCRRSRVRAVFWGGESCKPPAGRPGLGFMPLALVHGPHLTEPLATPYGSLLEVQCGSWQNYPARVLNTFVEGSPPSRVRVISNPRNWGGQELLDDVTMTSEYSLLPDALAMTYSMTYTGATPQPLKTQEVPAFFVDRRLSVLVFYEGAKPWTGDTPRFVMPGGNNNYFTPTERCGTVWRAVLKNSMLGVDGAAVGTTARSELPKSHSIRVRSAIIISTAEHSTQ